MPRSSTRYLPADPEAAALLERAGAIAEGLRVLTGWRLDMKEPLWELGLIIWNWCRASRDHFVRLAGLLAAGKLRRTPPRPDEPEETDEPEDEPDDRRRRRRERPLAVMPTQWGWLLPMLRHDPSQYREQLMELLADPGLPALLAVAPPRVISMLRRLCQMLGMPKDEMPAELLPPKRRPPPQPWERPVPEFSEEEIKRDRECPRPEWMVSDLVWDGPRRPVGYGWWEPPRRKRRRRRR